VGCAVGALLLLQTLAAATSSAQERGTVLAAASTTLTESVKLGDASGEDYDQLGVAAALNNGWVLVGAPYANHSGTDSGTALVYSAGATSGVPVVPAEIVAGDTYGTAVGLDGNTVAIGAPGHGTNGAVYLFTYGFWWDQQAKLTATTPDADDGFGSAVAISGDYVIVGSSKEGTYAGAVYFFERNHPTTDSWGLATRRVSNDLDDHDGFGRAVAIDGERAVVGAPFEDTNGDNAGAAYVFERSAPGSGVWNQLIKLVPPDPIDGHSFGCSVGISGNLVAVGASGDGDGGTSHDGVYLFERIQSDLGVLYFYSAKLTAADATLYDQFGRSLSLHGSTLVVGAPNAAGAHPYAGAAYVFDVDTGQQRAKLVASDADEIDYLGVAVGGYGDNIVATAPGDDDHGDSSGSAYLFEIPIFADGFESGGTAAWSSEVGG